MTVLRVGRIQVSGTEVRRLRIGAITLSGTPPVTTVMRVGKITVSGTAAVRVNATAQAVAGPGETVTITASLADGGSPDSWSWTQVSGPTVTLSGSGGTRTFVCPSVMPPGSPVVIAITATKSAITSPPAQVSIAVLPQTAWSWDSVAGKWVGALDAPAT
jgi:hypothetical protein